MAWTVVCKMDLAEFPVEGTGEQPESLLVRLSSPGEYVDRFLGEDPGTPIYSEFIPVAPDVYEFNRRVPDVIGCTNECDDPGLLLYGKRQGPWYCDSCHLAAGWGS